MNSNEIKQLRGQLKRELDTKALIGARIARYSSDAIALKRKSKAVGDACWNEAHSLEMDILRERANLSAVELQVTLLQAKIEVLERGGK